MAKAKKTPRISTAQLAANEAHVRIDVLIHRVNNMYNEADARDNNLREQISRIDQLEAVIHRVNKMHNEVRELRFHKRLDDLEAAQPVKMACDNKPEDFSGVMRSRLLSPHRWDSPKQCNCDACQQWWANAILSKHGR